MVIDLVWIGKFVLMAAEYIEISRAAGSQPHSCGECFNLNPCLLSPILNQKNPEQFKRLNRNDTLKVF